MIYYNNDTKWFKRFNEAYVEMLKLILNKGHLVHPRQGSSLGPTKEVLNASFAIPSTMPLLTIAERKLSYAFAMLEPFYLFTNQEETDIVGALTTYAKNLVSLAYNEKTKKFDGNYGDRIHLAGDVPVIDGEGCLADCKLQDDEMPLNPRAWPSQLLRCYSLLAQDPNSRRAIITIHNPVWDKIDGDSKDIPCTLNLQFLIRDGRLHCFCQMRSNDIWYGTPHNVMMFTFLQRAMAGWLGVESGDYVHRANSLHMYEKHWEKAASIVDNFDNFGARGYFREDISPQVVYPTHCQPEVTYEQARGMIEWEKTYRENRLQAPMDKLTCKWRPSDVYEGRTIDFIKEFLANRELSKNNESK